MYTHSQTKEGEYPRTARELFHHSLGSLLEQFPERVIDRRRADDGRVMSVSAYSWPGAGSERGGSAEHMCYEQVVLLPERDGRVSVVSVGDKQFDSMHTALIFNDDEGSSGYGDISEYDIRSGGLPSYYSVLFRYSVTPSFADALLGYYHAHVKDKRDDRDYTFVSVLDDILEDGTRHFIGCPLFAVDPSDRSINQGGFYINRSGSVYDFHRYSFAEVSDYWSDLLRGDLPRREILSRVLAHYLQGEKVDSSFVTSYLKWAFAGNGGTIMGRSVQSNAYDSRSEEKGLQALKEKNA